MKTKLDEAQAAKAKRAAKAPHEPGPCNRRHTLGDAFRRHLKFEGDPEGTTRHVTKGRVRSEAPGAGREIISVPPGPGSASSVKPARAMARSSPIGSGICTPWPRMLAMRPSPSARTVMASDTPSPPRAGRAEP